MTTPTHADLYADLGLTCEASRADVTRAFRTLLREHHPDTRPHQQHPGPAPAHCNAASSGASRSGLALTSDEILNRAFTAYAALSDPDRRASYDRHQQRPNPVGGIRQTPPAVVLQATPTRAGARQSRFPGSAPAGTPLTAPPPIRVGPVRWH